MFLIHVELFFVCGTITHVYSFARVYSAFLCYALKIPYFPHRDFPVPLLGMSCLSLTGLSPGSQFYSIYVCYVIHFGISEYKTFKFSPILLVQG